MEWFIRLLDPTAHWSQERYEAWWRSALETTLLGFWGKLLAAILIAAAIWFGARRGRFQLSLGLLILAALIMFGGGLWFSLLR